ncbi:hypothetical protein [Methylobacterium indicum]|uniref:hypothetical protein n=1 Tax=Methylobacterium indicum TaxID=1775910 RepID=UPI000A447469|nr:hypothetical protein [Methylobacterium indicum]
MSKSSVKISAGGLTAMLAIVSAGAASAASAQYTIQNSSGTTLTLDTASCTNGGTISPPFSVANGSTVYVTGSVSGNTTLCNIRYQNSSGGCQFQVQVFNSGGFASTNAYKGSSTCTKLNEGSTGSNSYSGSFRMQ